MHKPSVHQLALDLRKKGFAYPYIAKKTGLSKSTLSDWLSNIPYTPNKETIAEFGRARAAAAERKTQIRQQLNENIRKVATRDIGRISKRDLFLFGLALYLGEGAKSNGQIRMMNSDPRIIQATIAWFEMLGVKKSQLAMRLHLYPDTDLEASLQFWSRTTSIPVSQFQKPQIDRRTDKKAKMQGKLPFGTAQLSVRSHGRKDFGILFFRKIQAWNEAVLTAIQKADVV